MTERKIQPWAIKLRKEREMRELYTKRYEARQKGAARIKRFNEHRKKHMTHRPQENFGPSRNWNKPIGYRSEAQLAEMQKHKEPAVKTTAISPDAYPFYVDEDYEI